jgi:internalin A
MPARSFDQHIVARLWGDAEDIERRTAYDDQGYLVVLDLSELGISQILPDIGQLKNLQVLYLRGNQLREVPESLGQLKSLQELDLRGNQLREVPESLGQLQNLQVLDLDGNQLREVPESLGQLQNLEKLDLGGNQLREVPESLGQLQNLQWLDLDGNQLREVPESLGQLQNLQVLYLEGNQLREVPESLGQLQNLQWLDLGGNQLREVPESLGQLKNLEKLYLYGNQLREVPEPLGRLKNVQGLYLYGNQLREVPESLGQLKNVQVLDLGGNQLTQIPVELGQLKNVQELSLAGNSDLLTPPPEVVSQGTEAILSFLRELQKDRVVRYEAKVVVVGQGETGKSSLLRALRHEEFTIGLPTTHGIEVGNLQLPHPYLTGVELTLNTWDFGGQHIYHATHQFFLTRRSLYLLVWDARAEEGRLDFWLETIRILAPEAPILLVATHADERSPDLNYGRYTATFPQLAGHFEVSNKDHTGIDELALAIARHAAGLRLMGQPWPRNWVQAEHRLLALPDHHVDADAYASYCIEYGIGPEIAHGTLGSYLHDLGKILYFQDDSVLSNFVVLKPNWVTKAISLVLTDEQTKRRQGILSHADLARIWDRDDKGRPYEPYLYPTFLRMMERFDLSYQIDPERPGSLPSRSLVPQLLPYQPPADLPPWPQQPLSGQTYVEMHYRFDFVPAGIMPWFIVRTHRYTQNLHWNEGVVLHYQDHRARVELNPSKRELRMVVWGIQPLNFFNILMNTMDLLLERFEGLHVQREVPCICAWQEHSHASSSPASCPRFYRYEDLVRRMNAGKHQIECEESWRGVSVLEMLYGIHVGTHEQVIADIRRGQQKLIQSQQQVEQTLTLLPEMLTTIKGLSQLTELIWRQTWRQWHYEMERVEVECPNTFYLSLGASGTAKRLHPKNWVSQEYKLHLICQHPPGPHPVGEGYSLREAKDWWLAISPWLNRLVAVLKVVLPVGTAIGTIYDTAGFEQIQKQLTLMEEISDRIPQLGKLNTLSEADPDPHLHRDQQATGAALRALHQFLVRADPSHNWGGLSRVVTLDGNVLWLCEKHRQEFAARPLDQRYAR